MLGRDIEWLHVEVVEISLVQPVTFVYNYKQNIKQLHSMWESLTLKLQEIQFTHTLFSQRRYNKGMCGKKNEGYGLA